MKLILINTISKEYLVRYQAPLALNLISDYLQNKNEDLTIKVIDMQNIFSSIMKNHTTRDAAYSRCIELTLQDLISNIDCEDIILGFSLKWNTQSVAAKIISAAKCKTDLKNILVVLGNIGSTYGYTHLLNEPEFKDALAVLGEGEEALNQIIKMYSTLKLDRTNTSKYADIPNVATNIDGTINVKYLERVDLQNCPDFTYMSDAIYDKEWDVYAIETSRGCPWGKCTFCSIGCQFGCTPEGRKGNQEWRGYPIKTILNNFRRLADQGVRRIDIKDSEFFGPMDNDNFDRTISRINEFSEGLSSINKTLDNKKKGDKMIMNHISARVDTIYREGDDEKNKIRLDAYKSLIHAGLKGIYLGIESGSITQLIRYCKGVSPHESEVALKIAEELGLEVEVGFIFFDPLCTLDELEENLKFIEKTKIYKTDSRILGSLRIQEGSTYKILANNAMLLGDLDKDSLSYESRYGSEIVKELSETFERWEDSTRKIVRLLDKSQRIEQYTLNFRFLRDMVKLTRSNDKKQLCLTMIEYCNIRTRLLDKIRSRLENENKHDMLCEEYLSYAYSSNSDMLREAIKEAKRINTQREIETSELAFVYER